MEGESTFVQGGEHGNTCGDIISMSAVCVALERVTKDSTPRVVGVNHGRDCGFVTSVTHR